MRDGALLQFAARLDFGDGAGDFVGGFVAAGILVRDLRAHVDRVLECLTGRRQYFQIMEREEC